MVVYAWIFKDWWLVLYLKQWCLMQCSTLHYITLRTALLRYCFKKKSVSRHPLSQERCQHKQDLIYFKWSPAVMFSLAMVSLAGVPKFVVTVNSLSLKRLWRHDLHARFFYLSILFTPLHLSRLSPSEFGFCLFLITSTALCSRLLCHQSSWNFDWEETKHQPPSVFLGQVQNEIQ